MNIERRDFDKEATTWDEVPTRIKLANDIAAAISNEILLTSSMDVLDFVGAVEIEFKGIVRYILSGVLDIPLYILIRP